MTKEIIDLDDTSVSEILPKSPVDPKDLLSENQVALRIILVIVIAQLVTVSLLTYITRFANETFPAFQIFLNFVFMACLATPVIYFWVIRPFVRSRDSALEKISQLAHCDELTGVPNRRMFNDYFYKMISNQDRHSKYGAVLLIDLDGFKQINDGLGHDAGDAVLVEVADRIRSNIRKEDIVARLGGDEFVVAVLFDVPTEDAAISHAEMVRDKLSTIIEKPIQFNDQTIPLSASIGLRITGSNLVVPKNALRDADVDMYEEKKAKRRMVETSAE